MHLFELYWKTNLILVYYLNMVLLLLVLFQSLRFLGPTPPFLYLKACNTFSQIEQNRPSQKPAVTRSRDAHAPISRKYVYT